MWIKIAQIVIAVALIVVILLQNKGAGLGNIFGGSGNIFSTKRGVDKILFRLTVALVVAFFGISLWVVWRA